MAPQPWVWITCRWCQAQVTVPYARRPDGPRPQLFCSISCGSHASALRLSDAEWSARNREAGRQSGRVRRGIALRRAIKALGAVPTLAELRAFHLGWECHRQTMQQRRRRRATAV